MEEETTNQTAPTEQPAPTQQVATEKEKKGMDQNTKRILIIATAMLIGLFLLGLIIVFVVKSQDPISNSIRAIILKEQPQQPETTPMPTEDPEPTLEPTEVPEPTLEPTEEPQVTDEPEVTSEPTEEPEAIEAL